MKSNGLVIKASKMGDESGKSENLNMLTRKVGGEVCLDVECGPNKAVLYVAKLFGGTKKLCILYEEEWITPNEFQNVSGRRSAKDWKRSIRHNGVSLKTFMLSGVLGVPEDSSSLKDRGSAETSPDYKATGKVQHKRKLKKKTKRKQRHNVKTVRSKCVTPEPVMTESESVMPQSVTSDSMTPYSVTPDSIADDEMVGSDSDTQMAIEPSDVTVTTPDDNNVPDVTAAAHDDIDVDTVQSECDIKTMEDTPYSKVVESETKVCRDNYQDRSKEVINTMPETQDPTRLSSMMPTEERTNIINKSLSTDETNRQPVDHRGFDNKRTIMDPYEVTVTPPPTPPSDDRKDHVNDHMTDTHMRTACETNNATGVVLTGRRTIEYRPYLNSHEHTTIHNDSNIIASQDANRLRASVIALDYTKGRNSLTFGSRYNTVASPIATSLTPFHLDQKIPSESMSTRSPDTIRDFKRERKHCNPYPSTAINPTVTAYPSITSVNNPYTPHYSMKHGQTDTSIQGYKHAGEQTKTSAHGHRYPNGVNHSACKCDTIVCSPERSTFVNQFGGNGLSISSGRGLNMSLSNSPRSSLGCSPRPSTGSSSGSSVGGSPGLYLDNTHKAQKRHFDELYSDKPLDLSMKKTRIRDHDDITITKSRDRGHVTNGSSDRNDKPMKSHHANMLTFPTPMAANKNTSSAIYPFINPLNTMHPLSTMSKLHYEHNVGQLSPCLCNLCVNPVSLYVPYVWDWRRLVEHKV